MLISDYFLKSQGSIGTALTTVCLKSGFKVALSLLDYLRASVNTRMRHPSPHHIYQRLFEPFGTISHRGAVEA